MNFDVKKFIEEEKERLRKKIGDGKAIVAVSGGVDSTACTILAHQVLGSRLKVIFIDDGLMRQDEGKTVKSLLARYKINLIILNKQKEFFATLKGLVDPEEKRKAFRDRFYKVFGNAIRDYKAKFLIQGTIAADILETRKKIKTQHNVLSQIEINPSKYGLEIIEPLKRIYKPEVRLVASALGLPAQTYKRMPFPGPGLLCRVIGEVTPPRVKIVREATRIVEKHLKRLKPFQAFAVLLDDKATGISRGKRLFGNIIVIRSVESKDALTAKPTEVSYRILNKIQREITKTIPQTVKVLYDLSPKPPSTIEYI